MVFTSSPVAYPPTSSPQRELPRPRKMRKLSHDGRSAREPLKTITNMSTAAPKTLAGFLMEDDDSDDDLQPPLGYAAEEEPQDPFEQFINFAPTPSPSPQLKEQVPQPLQDTHHHQLPSKKLLSARTCSGKKIFVHRKKAAQPIHYERLVAARSEVENGKAQKSFYGIDIHNLMVLAEAEANLKAAQPLQSASREPVHPSVESIKPRKSLMWTEKYRARKFTDLVGDERTHRSVLHWFKAWDAIVFPHQSKSKARSRFPQDDANPERPHRKILLLTGPPGLGKTTLAHVCARQAGYEAQEINASDERSRDVVRGRIRDMVGTENVRSISNSTTDASSSKVAKPVCVIVDEVDGVVGGSNAGGGEGGFIKALLELIALDQKNSTYLASKTATSTAFRGKRKGDNFRMLRPLILICNDLYHPSLRLLRQGSMAEIIHVRKPAISMVVPRMQNIFVNEGVPCDSDGVRHLCEAAWGVSTRKEDRSSSNGACEGDIRGILVLGEWVASKLRNAPSEDDATARLTKRWIEKNLLGDLAHGGSAARSLGRGGSKEVVDRVFAHNAGFPASSIKANASLSQSEHVAETGKKQTMERLREMIESSGEDERIMTDVFTAYPAIPYQDDTLLSKPSHAYDWLHFHSTALGLVHTQQEWELAPYLSYPVLAFHSLFASNIRSTTGPRSGNALDATASESEPAHPFTGPRSSYTASETQKSNAATLSALQSSLGAHIQRSFRSPASLSTELVPYVLRMLNPDVKPVVVGGSASERGVASVRKGSERELVMRGVNAMVAAGIKFERSRLEFGEVEGPLGAPAMNGGGWIMRMEPPLDDLGVYPTFTSSGTTGGPRKSTAGEKVRYAVRQVLEQEHKREVARLENEARLRRAHGSLTNLPGEAIQAAQPVKPEDLPLKQAPAVKRDFFGRPIVLQTVTAEEEEAAAAALADDQGGIRSKRAKTAARGSAMKSKDDASGRIWVSYHEGYSNAVRKPVTMRELLEGL